MWRNKQIVVSDSKGRILFPSWMRKQLKTVPGDRFTFSVEDDCIIAKKHNLNFQMNRRRPVDICPASVHLEQKM